MHSTCRGYAGGVPWACRALYGLVRQGGESSPDFPTQNHLENPTVFQLRITSVGETFGTLHATHMRARAAALSQWSSRQCPDPKPKHLHKQNQPLP